MNLLLNKPKIFVYQVSLLFFVLTDKIFSSHTDQISEHMNLSNHKIHSHNKMREIIVNLGGKKFENNNNSICQLSCLQNSLLMSIVNSSEKDLWNAYRKSNMRRVQKSSVKSSSTLFSFSILAMYNIVHCAKKTSHVKILSS